MFKRLRQVFHIGTVYNDAKALHADAERNAFAHRNAAHEHMKYAELYEERMARMRDIMQEQIDAKPLPIAEV